MSHFMIVLIPYINLLNFMDKKMTIFEAFNAKKKKKILISRLWKILTMKSLSNHQSHAEKVSDVWL